MSNATQRIDLTADVIGVKVETGRRKFRLGQSDVFELDIALAWDRWVALSRATLKEARDNGAEDLILPVDQFAMECTQDEAILQKTSEAERLQFVEVLRLLMDGLKKNMLEQLGLPTSTDSTPSTSNPGN